MNRNKLIMIGIVLLILSWQAIQSKPSDEKKAADFSLQSLTGQSVSLRDYQGKVVILNFWATWCAPCLREMPELESLYQKYKDDDLQIIGIAVVSKKEDIPKQVETTGVTYPVLIGNKKIIADYGYFSSIPHTFLIDKEGFISEVFAGSIKKEKLEKSLIDMLSK